MRRCQNQWTEILQRDSSGVENLNEMGEPNKVRFIREHTGIEGNKIAGTWLAREPASTSPMRPELFFNVSLHAINEEMKKWDTGMLVTEYYKQKRGTDTTAKDLKT